MQEPALAGALRLNMLLEALIEEIIHRIPSIWMVTPGFALLACVQSGDRFKWPDEKKTVFDLPQPPRTWPAKVLRTHNVYSVLPAAFWTNGSMVCWTWVPHATAVRPVSSRPGVLPLLSPQTASCSPSDVAVKVEWGSRLVSAVRGRTAAYVATCNGVEGKFRDFHVIAVCDEAVFRGAIVIRIDNELLRATTALEQGLDDHAGAARDFFALAGTGCVTHKSTNGGTIWPRDGPSPRVLSKIVSNIEYSNSPLLPPAVVPRPSDQVVAQSIVQQALVAWAECAVRNPPLEKDESSGRFATLPVPTVDQVASLLALATSAVEQGNVVIGVEIGENMRVHVLTQEGVENLWREDVKAIRPYIVPESIALPEVINKFAVLIQRAESIGYGLGRPWLFQRASTM